MTHILRRLWLWLNDQKEWDRLNHQLKIAREDAATYRDKYHRTEEILRFNSKQFDRHHIRCAVDIKHLEQQLTEAVQCNDRSHINKFRRDPNDAVIEVPTTNVGALSAEQIAAPALCIDKPAMVAEAEWPCKE